MAYRIVHLVGTLLLLELVSIQNHNNVYKEVVKNQILSIGLLVAINAVTHAVTHSHKYTMSTIIRSYDFVCLKNNVHNTYN